MVEFFLSLKSGPFVHQRFLQLLFELRIALREAHNVGRGPHQQPLALAAPLPQRLHLLLEPFHEPFEERLLLAPRLGQLGAVLPPQRLDFGRVLFPEKEKKRATMRFRPI